MVGLSVSGALVGVIGFSAVAAQETKRNRIRNFMGTPGKSGRVRAHRILLSLGHSHPVGS